MVYVIQTKSIGGAKEAKVLTPRLSDHGSSTVSRRFEYPNTQQVVDPTSPTRFLHSEQDRISESPTLVKKAESSTRSNRVSSSEARFRRVKAEMEKKHRLEMQEIERQQQSIEQKLEMIRIKQDVELKRAELQRKRVRALQLQSEIQVAELEEKLSCDQYSTCDKKLSAKELTNDLIDAHNVISLRSTCVNPDVPIEGLSRHNESTTKIWNSEQVQQRGFRNESLHLGETIADDMRVAGRLDVPGNLHWRSGLASRENDFQETQRILETQQESLIKMAQTLETSTSKGFEMPKRDYLILDGNPINYPRFKENFRINKEERE